MSQRKKVFNSAIASGTDVRYVMHIAGLLALLMAQETVAASSVSGRVIDDQGKPVAGAVVFVQDPVSESATRTAIMDQFNKTFIPGVLPVVVGTQVKFPNRDQIRHHVYSFSRTKRFELPLYKGEEAPPVAFDKPGVVQIGCNIHDWMSAVILVLPNSHYAVTDESGSFTLEDAPEGSYSLAAWHERSRAKVEEVSQQIRPGSDNSRLTFQLALAPPKPRASTRGSRGEP
jgi:plastocyanin